MAEEREVTAASSNIRKVLKLIRNTGKRRVSVNETMCGGGAQPIRDKQQRFDGWAGYFKEDSTWPRGNVAVRMSADASHPIVIGSEVEDS